MRTVGYGKYRITGKGLTLDFDAPALADNGRITSAQLESIVGVNDGTYYASADNPAVDLALVGMDEYTFTDIHVPDTSQFLVNGAPNCYQGKAIDGAYIVHKFVGPLSAQQYQNTGEFALTGKHYATAANVDLMFPETFLTITSHDGPVDDQFGLDSFTPDSSAMQYIGSLGLTSTHGTPMVPIAGGSTVDLIHPYVSRPCDVTTSITFVEGMQLGGGVGTSPGNASIRVKTRLFLENISTGAGAVSPFAHRSPVLDQRALDVVATVAQTGMDAYPARYNSFGEILGNIWNGIKSVATPLLNVGKFIPGVGSFANMGLAGISGIDAIRSALGAGGH